MTHRNEVKLNAIEKFAKKLYAQKELSFKFWKEGYEEEKHHSMKRYKKIVSMLERSEAEYQRLLHN